MKHSCLLYWRRSTSQCCGLRRLPISIKLSASRHNSSLSSAESNSPRDFFEYTSGRWVYNEEQRRRERERVFDAAALRRLAAEAVSRHPGDILSMSKVGEGAANRAFVIQFRDGFKLVARIPYLATVPRPQVVASEAAALAFLRSKRIPVPRVYGYSASADNPAGTEYILMEFSQGRNLGSLWADMNDHQQLQFIKSLVKIERHLFDLHLPASGSLYFHRDLSAASRKVAVDTQECDGPSSLYIGEDTSLPLWFGRRGEMDVDRGPYTESEAVMNAGAEKEMRYLAQHGRPLLPFDRMRREIFNLERQPPSVHLDSLQKYLQISRSLIPKASRELTVPVLRHRDFRPSNIFVSDDYPNQDDESH